MYFQIAFYMFNDIIKLIGDGRTITLLDER